MDGRLLELEIVMSGLLRSDSVREFEWISPALDRIANDPAPYLERLGTPARRASVWMGLGSLLLRSQRRLQRAMPSERATTAAEGNRPPTADVPTMQLRGRVLEMAIRLLGALEGYEIDCDPLAAPTHFTREQSRDPSLGFFFEAADLMTASFETDVLILQESLLVLARAYDRNEAPSSKELARVERLAELWRGVFDRSIGQNGIGALPAALDRRLRGALRTVFASLERLLRAARVATSQTLPGRRILAVTALLLSLDRALTPLDMIRTVKGAGMSARVMAQRIWQRRIAPSFAVAAATTLQDLMRVALETRCPPTAIDCIVRALLDPVMFLSNDAFAPSPNLADWLHSYQPKATAAIVTQGQVQELADCFDELWTASNASFERSMRSMGKIEMLALVTAWIDLNDGTGESSETETEAGRDVWQRDPVLEAITAETIAATRDVARIAERYGKLAKGWPRAMSNTETGATAAVTLG